MTCAWCGDGPARLRDEGDNESYCSKTCQAKCRAKTHDRIVDVNGELIPFEDFGECSSCNNEEWTCVLGGERLCIECAAPQFSRGAA